MAIFGSKSKKKDAPIAETAMVAAVPQSGLHDMSHIIRRPRITEKAALKAENNVYVFEVATDANKKSIAAAVKELYKVNPIRIAITQIPAKQVIVRGKRGVSKGGKKAYVYLKKGETIEFA